VRNLIQEFEVIGLEPFDFAFSLAGCLPLPMLSPLLYKVNTDPDVKFAIGCFRRQRSRALDRHAVYIQLLSKQSLRSSEDTLVALQKRMRNFLESRRDVFLVLEDSGAGKPTFGGAPGERALG